MRLLLRILSYFAYAGLLTLGLGYFGTNSFSLWMKNQNWFRESVQRPLDRLLGEASVEGARVGKIKEIVKNGEIRFKSENAFNFAPVSPNQEFFGKTLLSTGPGVEIVVSLGNDSFDLRILENTTLALDPNAQNSSGESFEVDIFSGQVKAEKTSNTSETARLSLQDNQSGGVATLSGDSDKKEAELLVEKDMTAATPLPVLQAPIVSPQAETTAPVANPPPVQTPSTGVSSAPNTVPTPVPMNEAPRAETSEASGEIPFEESQEGFNRSVEKFFSKLLEEEMQKGECAKARKIYQDMLKTYAENDRLLDWKKIWEPKLKSCPR